MNHDTIRNTLQLLHEHLLLLRQDAIGSNDTEIETHELEDGWRAAEVLECQLHSVLAALSRLEDGTYGTCVGCGQPIGELVLARALTSTRCDECAPTEVFSASAFTLSRGWADQHAAGRR